jgi:hypothetical protein
MDWERARPVAKNRDSSKRRRLKAREEVETTNSRTKTDAKEGVPNPGAGRFVNHQKKEKKGPWRKRQLQISADPGCSEENISPTPKIRPWRGGLPDAELLIRLLILRR